MEWLSHEIPFGWQWVGLVATILGTVLSCASLIAATISAKRAKAASESADRAWRAAKRLGRLTQLAELATDLQELQALLMIRLNIRVVAAKCDRIKGRISRFRSEGANELNEIQLEDLDRARTQLDIMSKTLMDQSMKPEVRHLQGAFGLANEAIGRVAGSHSQQISEDANVAI